MHYILMLYVRYSQKVSPFDWKFMSTVKSSTLKGIKQSIYCFKLFLYKYNTSVFWALTVCLRQEQIVRIEKLN